ncbi:alkylmercury lyase family protein [Jatrophihabitans cynanchi]|uniref:alkylmercury lyase family protein n=1 Tax=Jatrophihabitans cynanchi TaxID=2944128 RepID=UPI0038B37CBA
MRLTILHVPDCPNVATLADRLGEVIAGRGDLDVVDVNRQVVDSEQAARELGMTGSPTLLVDGRDPFAEPDRAASLSCRLYRDETGQLVGAPSVAQLRGAIVESAVLGSADAGIDQAARVQRDCCATAADAGDSAVSLEERRARTAPTHPAGQAVHRAILRAFASTGRAPAAAELESIAAVHGATAHEVLVNLHNMDAVRLDADNQIAVAYPFSATPTRHRVRLTSGIEVWAMCAIDALGMPAMLDTDAVITSSDPANGRPVTVTVADGRYLWDPVTAVVFLSATAGSDAPSAETCCNDLNFFTTPASAQTWIDAHPQLRGDILDRARAEHRGQRIFGTLLHSRPSAPGDPVTWRG